MTIPQPEDTRLTVGLLADIFQLLERHGYRRADSPDATARSLFALLQLTRAFEGQDIP